MPTHKTKTTEIDAIKYTGSNDAAIITFLGNELYFDDGPVWFPDDEWAVGTKVVWTSPVWTALPVNSWLVKDGTFSVMSNEDFMAVYENV